MTRNRAREIYSEAWKSSGYLKYWELPEWPEIKNFWDALPGDTCFMECISIMTTDPIQAKNNADFQHKEVAKKEVN